MNDDAARSRAILNANRGVSNVIDHDVISHDLQNVADRLFKTLKGHYGPFSGFAALDNGDPLQETVFTKDGIGIVRSIEFASPQEDWVRKTIAYIGSRIESMVGDGTTSAMMFTCAMLKHMLQHLDEIKPISFNKLRRCMDDTIEAIKQVLDKRKFAVDKENPNPEMVSDIVYNQVYTSSHGDEELADAMAEVFSNTPSELWDRMIYDRRTYESDERFVVNYPQGQYQMKCEVMMPDMLNKEMSTSYSSNNALLYIINDSIRIDGPFWHELMVAMGEEAPASDDAPIPEHSDVVVISHKRMDTNSYQELLPLLNKWKNAGKSLAIFQIDPAHPKINDFITLQLLNGIDVTKVAHDYVTRISGVEVEFKQDLLTLDKLYVEPENWDSSERPHVTNGTNMQYRDYMEAVKKQADYLSKLEQTPDLRRQRTAMYRMYAKIRYTSIPTITIGGNAYDNLAMIDVLDDCMRAAAKALTNGVVFGNNRSLYLSLDEAVTWFGKEHVYSGKDDDRICEWIIKCIRLSLEDIALAAWERMHPKDVNSFWARRYAKKHFANWWFHHLVDLLDYDSTYDWRKHPSVLFAIVSNGCELSHYISGLDPVIVQPANTDISMLERFAEVALKYVLTERIIVHGAAYVDKRRKS